MKKVYILALLIFVSGVGFGQQQRGNSFNLEQAIAYALQNSIRSKNADLDQRIAKAKVKETVGIGLPQISAGASLVNNPQLPRFFTT